jgi:hypothetical protein
MSTAHYFLCSFVISGSQGVKSFILSKKKKKYSNELVYSLLVSIRVMLPFISVVLVAHMMYLIS